MPPPWPVKIGQKKMAAMRGGLYFMFLGPPLSKVSGSATAVLISKKLQKVPFVLSGSYKCSNTKPNLGQVYTKYLVGD